MDSILSCQCRYETYVTFFKHFSFISFYTDNSTEEADRSAFFYRYIQRPFLSAVSTVSFAVFFSLFYFIVFINSQTPPRIYTLDCIVRLYSAEKFSLSSMRYSSRERPANRINFDVQFHESLNETRAVREGFIETRYPPGATLSLPRSLSLSLSPHLLPHRYLAKGLETNSKFTVESRENDSEGKGTKNTAKELLSVSGLKS